MIFTSFAFLLFFAAVLLIKGCIRDLSAEKWFLVTASYLFYMTWGPLFVLLLLATSFVAYFIGAALDRISDRPRRRMILVLGLAVNVTMLAYFKYTNFLLDNVWLGLHLLGFSAPRWHYDILLPVGISFFTFQSMTYTIGVYRQDIKPVQNLRDLLLFVSFFPQLLAGPINRAADLLPQFRQRMRATAVEFESGLAQFALGAAKKLVISDRISPHVDLIFNTPYAYDRFTLLQGLFGYAVQIYCDFSGYSDMAIGCARMMGFRFMENFQMPYSAASITEFWRRWHISLSTWFRDYVYIPLGGNRKGAVHTYLNLMLTMFLCGLWHGASWTFVLWGGLHGVSLAIHKAWRIYNPLGQLTSNRVFRIIWTVVSHLLTLGVVLLGWLLFRSPSLSSASQYLNRLLIGNDHGARLTSPYIVYALGVVLLIHLIFKKDRDWAQEIVRRPVTLRIGYYVVLTLIVVCLAANDSSPFIYFRF